MTDTVAPRRGLSDDRLATVERLAFVVTVVLAGAVFWVTPHPPMTDLAQHAGQVTLWHDLLLGASRWQPLVYVNYFTPYLVAYTLGLLATFVLPVATAMSLVLMLAYYGFVAACVAMRIRLGADPRLDWLFIPGFFGFAYAWGFFPFLVALPFGIFFMVLAHRYAERPTVASGVGLFAAELLLFFAHGLVFLFANGIGCAFLLLAQRRPARLLRAVLPYVGAGLWCVLYALVRLRVETSAIGEPLDIVWNWDASRFDFLMFSLGSPVKVPALGRGLILVLLLAAPVVLRARMSRNAAAFVPLAATAAVWLIVPDKLMNIALVFQRFAVFLLPSYAFIFRPGESSAERRSIVRLLWLPIASWAFLIMHVERLRAFTAESAAFEEVLAAAEPGHRALSLIFNFDSAALDQPASYWHFPLWYQAEKGGFVDLNGAGSLAPVVRYRPDRLPLAFPTAVWDWRHPALFNWDKDDAEIYRYFFVRRDTPLPPGFFPSGKCRPVLVKSAGNWSLFENVNCHRASF